MDLYLLAELKTIALKITTVDMLKPPPDFRSNFDSTPPPILIDAGVAILENEKIERHIMKAIPGGHNLFVQVRIFLRGKKLKINIILIPHKSRGIRNMYVLKCACMTFKSLKSIFFFSSHNESFDQLTFYNNVNL